MSAIDERNVQVSRLLNFLYEKAENVEYGIDESFYKVSLDKLFDTDAWGFREILLVVIIGMLLDSDFRASTGLYDCNPRAIYEGPIKNFLIEKEIPHRKSGPLNVAKAAVGLNGTWAAQRRPRDVADEVVKLVDYIEKGGKDRTHRIENVGVSLFRRLIEHSNNIEELAIDINPSSDPEFLYFLCCELIEKTPDAGNTPQRIAAYLLKNYHRFLNTGVVVTGEDDRASVTSTTSKKPGDINEENPEGCVRKVYEITVKPFDLARIRDSFDCVSTYNANNSADIQEIIVICRKNDCPSDMKSSGLNGYLGSYVYQNIVYYYWEIYEWVASTLQRMTPDGRLAFYTELNSYIDDMNTAENVKRLWRSLHQVQG